MLETQRQENPFVGLRPFEPEESFLFFGREGRTDELLNRLQNTRFLAVVGTSGSGKSSLVRAGLLPALYGGFMVGASSIWRVVVMRPGDAPIKRLAEALHREDALAVEPKYADIQPLVTETTLRLSSLGLIEVVRRARLPQEENLLIVVDQFEELFRFKAKNQTDEATNEAISFVNLLLESSKYREASIYVVLTLRSDFLGECAQFRDLPEAMNQSQYLIPRMTRDELRSAIVGPTTVSGARITSSLVNQLLNEVGDNPDQLPVLQHALMRTWSYWKDHHAADEPIDSQHYERIGRMEKALSIHADEVYCQLDDREKKITEVLFKQLTETGVDNRGFRRPARLGEIAEVAETSIEHLSLIVQEFRQPGRSFVIASNPLIDITMLDISHESLMRIWDRLKNWVEAEAEDAQTYRLLAQKAALHTDGKESLLSGAALTSTAEWFDHKRPTTVWAERYALNFDEAIRYLDDSRLERDREMAEQERLRKKERLILLIRFTIASLVSTSISILCFFAVFQYREAKKGQLSASSSASEAYFASDQQLEALIESLKAGEQLKQARWSGIDSDTMLRTLSVLRQRVYDVRERNRLRGYSNWLSDVTFSPDGQLIATGSSDGTIKVWQRDGHELKTFVAHTSYVSSVQWSPDSQMLASASWDGSVKLWNQNGRLIRELKSTQAAKAHSDSVKRVSFSPDGQTIASASDDKTIKLWNVQTGMMVRTLHGHSRGINSVRFSRDGKTLISAGKDGTIRLWRSSDGSLLNFFSVSQSRSQKIPEVEDANVSPDGQIIISATRDEPLKVWERNGKALNTLKEHEGTVYRVEFSPDGTAFASASRDGTVKLWNLDNLESSVETFKGHQGTVYSVSFSPDGQTIASASEDKTVRLWSRDISKLVTRFIGHQAPINRVSFSPNGQTIASASEDKTVKLWNRTGKLERTLDRHKDTVRDVSFSFNGQIIATASQDKTINLWGKDGNFLRTLSSHADGVNTISFSRDDKTIASGSEDGNIELWSLQDGKILSGGKGKDSVFSVSFSPDGTAIASGGSDQALRVWFLRDGLAKSEVLASQGRTITRVSFSPDGRRIAWGSNNGIVQVWERDKSENRLFGSHGSYINSVRFSADGRILISTSEDRSIKLWEVQTGKVLNTFRGHFLEVTDASFDFNDRAIISSSVDRTLILWNLDLDTLLKQGCSEIRDYLSTLPKQDQTICNS